MKAAEETVSAAGLLAEMLERDPASIPADASIFNFPAWDSLAHARLMLAVEAQSGRPIEPAAMAALVSLEAVDAYLAGKVSTKAK